MEQETNETISLQRLEKRVGDWVTPQQKTALWAALLCGLAAHLYAAAKDVQALDGLLWSFLHTSTTWEMSLGRWGLYCVYHGRNGVVSMPAIMIWGMVALSLAAVLLCGLFRPQSHLVAALMGASVTVAPQILQYYMVPCSADGYCWSFFFAVLSMYLVFGVGEAGKRKIVLRIAGGAVSLALALSVYQTHLGVAAVLAVFLLYRMLLHTEEYPDYRPIAFKAGGALLVGISGTLLYQLVLKLWLLKDGTALGSYSGADQISISAMLAHLPGSLWNPYHFISEYFLFDNVIYNTTWKRQLWWLLFFAAAVMMQLVMMAKHNLFRNPLRVILMGGLGVLSPMAACIISIIVPWREMTLIMSGAVILFLPCLLALSFDAPLADDSKGRVAFAMQLTCLAAATVLLWTQFWQVQASYMVVESNIQQQKTIFQDVYTRAAQQEGFSVDSKWYVNESSGLVPVWKTDEFLYGRATGAWTEAGVLYPGNSARSSCWHALGETYFGINLEFLYDSAAEEIRQGEVWQQMPAYPADGCVKVIDGVVMIKMSESQ